MDFGITFKGVVRPERARALVRQAENAGFTYCWFYDSHILWRESFVAIAMLMEHTTKMRFGPCVTNPNTRDWSLAASLFGSLALQSRGRFDLGVGRGDSAVRVMGKKPATLARLEEFVHVVKALVRGEEAQYEGCPEPVKFPWVEGYDLPVWVAAYGPMALGSAGRLGDGLVLQLAEPGICKWLADQAIEAGRKAGRDMSGYQVMSAAPAYTGSIEEGRERTKWFPAMVGNHVADIVADAIRRPLGPPGTGRATPSWLAAWSVLLLPLAGGSEALPHRPDEPFDKRRDRLPRKPRQQVQR
jgi:probable F420-dependent oxidoreductase